MKTPTYEIGMIVEHPARPQWGRGKVVAVTKERVHVVFRGELERKAKAILTSVVALEVAAEQSDAILDVLPAATQDEGSWMLPKNYERLIQRATERVEAEAARAAR